MAQSRISVARSDASTPTTTRSRALDAPTHDHDWATGVPDDQPRSAAKPEGGSASTRAGPEHHHLARQALVAQRFTARHPKQIRLDTQPGLNVAQPSAHLPELGPHLGVRSGGGHRKFPRPSSGRDIEAIVAGDHAQLTIAKHGLCRSPAAASTTPRYGRIRHQSSQSSSWPPHGARDDRGVEVRRIHRNAGTTTRVFIIVR